MIEPKLSFKFKVIAYDCGGYGDDRSKEFTNGQEAVDYARSLEPRFGAVVYKYIIMEPMMIKIEID